MLSKRTLLMILLVTGIGLYPASFTATSQSTYGITVPGSIDTPQRTFTIEETEYQVSEIASIAPGDAIPVDVTAPESTTYDVYLYNAEKQIQNTKAGEGSERVMVETTGLSPGTYLLAIYKEGQYKSIYPIVLSRYTVSLDVPSTARQGETVEVEVSTSGSEQTPSEVNVVLADSEINERSLAVHQSDGRYVATISLGSIPEGTYSVYASAHGDKEIDGKKEVLGLSKSAAVQIRSEPTPNEDGTDQDGSVPESTTKSPRATTVSSETRTPRTPTTSQSVTTLSTTNTLETTGSPSTTEPSVITANPPSRTARSTTQSSGQSGFGLLTALTGFLAVLAVSRRLIS